MSSLATSGLRSLFAGFTQDTRLLQLTTPLGGDALLAESVRGEEGVDQSFRFEIDALSLDAGIPLKRLVGQPALLQLLTSRRGGLRSFHGYVTAARLLGSNGGLARYRLRLEPWTAFLGIGRDCRVFQDMSVCEIADAVFCAWRGKGKLAPAWRFDLLDPSVYPKRSLATQYQESDLAFVLRLLNEEGLFCYFEHQGAPSEAPFGSHTLVIADHNHAFKPCAQADVGFSQPGAVMKEDTLDSWSIRVRSRANAVALSSWDYRSCIGRPVVASDGAADLVMRGAMGQYAWTTPEHGERIAYNELLALDAQRERHTGAGTVRSLAPGTVFRVLGHDQLDASGDDEERTFVALRVAHLMHNNFNAEIRDAVRERLGAGLLADLIEQDLGDDALHAPALQAGARPLYRMRVEAMRSATPYRYGRFDEYGQPRYPKPNVGGQQTAIVVGPAGSVVQTDRDHRIKVQFHWQRGEQSHSRLRHPAPDGHAGAPSDDTAGTWVRVATPLGAIAGANWGANALPRVGQEVLIDFMEGDIARPVVIACLYNGRGEADAQHNQARYGAGAATGNAPAWFAGQAGAHAHPAVLSGVKSQAMAASADGSGGYSQLVFDASAGQPRVSLQRHAERHQGTDELNLGYLRHQVDNQRLAAAGFGAELKTSHSLAVRAGQGLLLSARRNGLEARMMESNDAHAQIDVARQLAQKLSDTAGQHGASKNTKPSAIERLAHSAKAIANSNSATPNTAYAEPHLQVSAPAGIAALTPCNAVISAGNTSSITAGQDINIVAQGALGHAATAGISLFTSGRPVSAENAIQEAGIRLHAASGKVSIQSQSDALRVAADRTVSVASITKEVRISAPQHVLLTAAGGAIRLENGNITLQCPGSVEFKAGSKELAGPQSANAEQRTMPKPGTIAACPGRVDSASTDGAAAL